MTPIRYFRIPNGIMAFFIFISHQTICIAVKHIILQTKKLIQAIRNIKLQIDLNKRYSSEKICITAISYGREIDTSRQFIISPCDSKYAKEVYIFGTRAQCNLIEGKWRTNSALRSEAFVKGNGTNEDFLNFFCKKFMFLKTMSKKILLLQNEIVKGVDLRLNNSIRLSRLSLEKL